MIDSCGKGHVAQMASHYNQVSAHTIGNNRHNHGQRNKYQAALQTAVSQVSIKSAQRKRRNQVAQATTGFNHGPVPARDGKKASFPVNRNARQLQCRYGKVGGKVYQRRNKRFPKGHRKQEISQAEKPVPTPSGFPELPKPRQESSPPEKPAQIPGRWQVLRAAS